MKEHKREASLCQVQLSLITGLALSLLLLVTPAFSEVVSEQSEPLGFDFRELTQSKRMPPEHFEAIGHFTYLYFKNIRISQTSDYVISSTGQFVVYSDGETGHVKVFYPSTKISMILEAYVDGNQAPYLYEEIGLGRIKATYPNNVQKVFDVALVPPQETAL
ncbi:hypothetical protein KJ365_01345 [Glaciecola sp. XM2]|uniref:hypothetical protein n=1 Tax=Glaciecola sp. XM2 TaxID=1914931 RepID=UPI001BDEA6FE|nr:hypothetical protein [Glaciecola sp. XM2]MBT1449511.1 hypothetical protein [Glaciecola sp. XM2]